MFLKYFLVSDQAQYGAQSEYGAASAPIGGENFYQIFFPNEGKNTRRWNDTEIF